MRLLSILLLFFGTIVAAHAQSPVQPYIAPNIPADSTHGLPVRSVGLYTPNGYQQLTSISGATGLTVPTGSVIAEICDEGDEARYRDDGTNPTTTVGMPVPAGTCFQYAGLLTAIKFIDTSSGAIVDVSYYK